MIDLSKRWSNGVPTLSKPELWLVAQREVVRGAMVGRSSGVRVGSRKVQWGSMGED